jgi:hypothetical protein
MVESLATALLLGGINTVFDFVWPQLKLGAPGGFGRIMLTCFAVGMIVGARAREILIGALGGLLVSVAVLSAYQYLLPTGSGYEVYVPWAVFWVAFGLIDGLLNRDRRIYFAVLQGVAAALASGAAYVAFGSVWSHTARVEATYLVTLIAWTTVFAPGFLILFWHRN